MRAHKLLSKAVVSLCALAATFAISCVPAGAEVTHKFLSSITEVPAQGPKGEAVAQSGLLKFIRAMAIDGEDLYVTEQVSSSGSRTDIFDTVTHAFVRQLELPSNPPIESAYQGLGVGHATGSTQIYIGAGERIGGNPFAVVVPFDAEGHQLGHSWTGEDTPAGAFSGHLAPNPYSGEVAFEGNLADVTVDNDTTSLLGDWAAGDVFVATRSSYRGLFPATNVIDILKPEAGGTEKYQTQLTGTCASPGACPGKVIPFKALRKIAVDPRNGDLLVVDEEENENNVIDMFRPGPVLDEYEFVGSVKESPQGPFGSIGAIAIDAGEGPFAEGDFYVADSGVVYQFDSTGQFVGRFSTSGSSVAVDPATHDVYLGEPEEEEGQVKVFGPSLLLPDVTTAPVSNLAPESATLNGTVNPDKAGAGATTCQFVWGTSESFGHTLPCLAPVAEGESSVPVSAQLEGLEPDTTYYFRLQANNANGADEGVSSQTHHFTTAGPGIAEESAFTISSTSATLGARVDPHGVGTTYYFQYGATQAYGSDVPVAPGESVGAGEGDIEVTPRQLQGLSPETTYHFRVVVVSDLQIEPGVFREATFDGRDQTFTTQTVGGSLVLPDGRAWELVSPVDKHGSILLSLSASTTSPIQSSASGDALTYGSAGPTETEPPGLAEGGGQVFSKRSSSGWSSQDIQLPHGTATGLAIGHGGDNRFFSEDLSLGVSEEIGGFTSLVPDTTVPDTERTPYLRHDDTCSASPSSCYVPLVTGAPGYADVPSGTVFDAEPAGPFGTVNALVGTPDLSHVLLASKVALTPEPIGAFGLYEWTSGKPPAEELQLIDGEDPTIPANGRDAISADGSRVTFEHRGAETEHLYQRDMINGQTVRLDEVQPGASGAGASSAIFEAASSDGSVVYFTDDQRLTTDSDARGNSSSGIPTEPDLYECKMHEAAGKEVCSLQDLTPETDGQRANVQKRVLGVGENGADVYFVATGVLTNQVASNGERAVAGAPNLYESHDGTTTLIAVLSPNDGMDWDSNSNPPEAGLAELTARVSPDGKYLAFMSDRSLTGYNNVDISVDRPDEEVFMFNSSADQLICASCNPTGARPQGLESGKAVVLNIAARIPGWTAFKTGGAVYQSRYLSDSGRLFFDSNDALVPQDINKNEDVYEYEPAGVGSCTASSVTYAGSSGGCVGLISSGTARGESSFLDASEDGNDVFFLTTEKLTVNDVDTSTDVYDAHVCSTEVPCSSSSSSSPPCVTADACRVAPLPQPAIFGSPSSATFAGAGNVVPGPARKVTPKSLTRGQKLARALKVCRRDKSKHKRAACEHKARKQYPSKQARRARVTKGSRG
jgi:hypothetical protein